jgi:hypothetical protein
MKKNKSYIFLSILFIGFLIFGYKILKGKEKKNQIIEIEFLSDQPIVKNSQDSMPKEITYFSDCYEQNDTIDYIARITFRRVDINQPSDPIFYSKKINASLNVRDAKKMFDDENPYMKATPTMSYPKDNLKNYPDTSSICVLRLVSKDDFRAKNSKIFFNDISLLKQHINQELKNRTLFKTDINKIIIILGNSQVNDEKPELPPSPPQEVEDEKDNPPISNGDKEWKEFNKNEKNLLKSGYQKGEGSEGDDLKYLVNPDGDEIQYFKKKKAKKLTIDVGLKMPKQNYFTWNKKIASEKLNVEILIDNGEDVPFRDKVNSNENFYTFKTNSRYDDVTCRVTLIIEQKDGIKLTGNLSDNFITKCGK